MIILHDFRLSRQAVATLGKYGETLAFDAQSVIHFAPLAGHPDLFCCTGLPAPVLAPNTPAYIVNKLKSQNIDFQFGKTFVGDSKDTISAYNVTISSSFVIHHRRYTDPVIAQNLQGKTYIHIKQSFARCSTMALSGDRFITSDKAVSASLAKMNIDCLYVHPEQIVLPGLNYGLIGGCMGVWKNQVFVSGSLNSMADGEKIRTWLRHHDFEVVELNQGPLMDGGGILFVGN